MMATVPLASSSLLPLLETLEDSTAGESEQTDAYLTITNRLSGEEGQQFLPVVVKHFPRLGKTIQTHIASEYVELSQAALHALGFCVFHFKVVSAIPASFAEELLTALSSLVVKSTHKSTCTRALWVIAKQNFPQTVVATKVPEMLQSLESVSTRDDIQSVVMEHEALNVVIRLLEQAPVQMGEGAVQWARLVIPLVVHSASKVRLRAAAALEMGMPLLLQKQQEVAAVIEPIMATKLIPELQKLFSTKNEANVLKLWPLFVKLLGKLLHRGGPFINSLLQLEEMGFRSSSANIKNIAFIAWKSLIDNFALNPDILCSAKRLKLLMQPLHSIQVRMEALLLTKLEVWWYLMVKLGPNMAVNFEQVGVPLLQCTLGLDSPISARSSNQSGAVGPSTPKAGALTSAFSSPATPRLNLNSSVHPVQAYPSIQQLGLEMLLHYFLGPEVTATAAKNKLVLSLEPLTHPLLSSPSSFSKHASLLISLVRDGFITIGSGTPEALLTLIWKNLISHVSTTLDSGNKKERQGCEVLTLTLQALQTIVCSEALSAQRILSLLEITGRGVPPRVLGSATYQVGKMDVLNGTPALFLIQLLFDSNLVSTLVEDERFFLCLETLVGFGLSGPTSALAFGEAVLGAMGRVAPALENKEHLLRMWSRVVTPLTDIITQTNEVNQGDALEHNFSAVYTALMFPLTYLLPGSPLCQASQTSMLASWARLYKVFARCSSLVVTAEENICCEELCAKMAAVLDTKTPPTLEAVAQVLLVIIESVDFSPYTPHFQQKMKSPHTPLAWVRKKRSLGNLFSYHALLVQSLEILASLEGPEAAGVTLVSVLSCLFTNLALATAVHEALACLARPLTTLYQQADRSQNEQPKFSSILAAKLEKLLAELLACLQTRSSLAYDSDLLQLLSPLLCVLFPHRSKQVRALVTQFWNATFANTAVLTYPDQLKPVLSQVKQKTPIILPGFQVVDVPDELSGQYSSESSQLETKLSGVQVSSVGKRDSLLARAGDMKDKNLKTSSKPVSVSTKLDFGSPKPQRREVLEEEASIDFVFIPPETKERVLTEHQKEVKRTKRVDIPAMYNNLDASLDTTVFSQYTQSQQESKDKLGADDQTEDAAKETIKAEVTQENMEDEALTKETQDYISPTSADDPTGEPKKDTERPADYEMPPKSPDVSVEAANGDVSTDPREGSSPNTSSDLISGTPQKPSSVRRQAFITLEKYVEGKAASPVRVTKFTGPLSRTSSSQEPSPSPPSSSSTPSQAGAGPYPQASQAGQGAPERSENMQQERGGTGEKEVEPVADTAGKRPSEGTEDEEEDIIPDTQAEVEQKAPAVEEVETDSQEESQGLLEGSQCSPSQQGEPRRSGRRRSKPLWQEEESDAKDKRDKKKTTPLQTDSQSQRRSSRSSQQLVVKATEEDGKDKLRKKASLKDKGLSSQSNSQLSSPAVETHSPVPSRSSRRLRVQSDSEELVKDKRKKRGAAEEELSQSGSTSESDGQSQGRRSLRIKLSVGAEGEGVPKRRSRAAKEEGSSQIDSHAAIPSQPESQTRGRDGQKGMLVSGSEEFDFRDQGKKKKKEEEKEDAQLSQGDSQESTPSSAAQTDSQSQGRPSKRSKVVSESQEPVKVDAKRSRREGTQDELSQSDSQTTTPSSVAQSDSQSLGRSSSAANQLEEPVKEEQIRSGGADATLSQSDSQTPTPSSATPPDGQSQGGGIGASKMSAEVAESDKSQNVVSDIAEKETVPTDSQLTPSTGRRTDGQKMHSRPTRLKLAQQQAKPSNSPSSAPATEAESSQGTPEHSQGGGRTTRRRAYQLSGSNTENSESDASEPREEVQKTRKRGRKSKSSEATPSPLTVVPQDPTDSSESSGKAEPQNTPTSETETPKDAEEPLTSQDSLVVRLPLVTENVMEQGEAETQEDMEGEVSEEVGPVIGPEKAETGNATLQIEESSAGSDAGAKPPVCTSPRKRARSKDTAASQEAGPGESQLSEDPGANETSQPRDQQAADPTQAGAPVPSPASNVVPSGDDVLMEPSALCTRPLSNESSSGSADKRENLSLQVSESSEEKVPVLDVPQSGEEKEEEKEVPMEEPEEEVPSELPTEEKELPTEKVPVLDIPQPGEEKEEAKAVPMEEPEEEVPSELPTEEKELPTEEEVPLEEEVAEEQVPDHDEKHPASVDATEEDRQDDAIDTSTGDIPAESSTAFEEEQLQQREAEQYTSVEESQPESDSSSTRTREEGEEEEQQEEVQAEADHDALPLQDQDQASGMEGGEEEAEEETQIDDDLDLAARAAGDSNVPLADLPASGLPVATATTDPCQDSPPKQRGLEALVGPEVGQSPSSKTRGVWSPLASPSTSILKKGQKRAFEEESPSSLIKSRRVSFADPIHHQELADDIDRRSPVIRTSAPRTSSPKIASSIPQLKYITTPTKGLVMLSPRNLHSPGYKSSKKCLISEMGQEPRAIPRDCVYPALVSCSTPVEAVLPKITSNVWPRGFGQLVRARNIKTVGDLSALTPSEIKTLPIRSPKISNVKKALRTYHEQQRKGRGDELKSFDETEKMKSEVEDACVPPNHEDEDKSLAMALLDEPMAVEQEGPQQDQTPQDGVPEGLSRDPKAQGLLSEVEALEALMTAEGLGRCSAEQLLHLHDRLGGMMRSVVVQLQSRLSQRGGQP